MPDVEQKPLVVMQEDDSTPVDLLSRDEFVERMISVAQTLAENKKNACYAINGEWGVGKTFVLNSFERRMKLYEQEDSSKDKYMIFHYNCWVYDYYQEPLIAVVAVLLDQIDKQVNLLTEEQREQIKAALRLIGNSLWMKARGIIAEKTTRRIAEIPYFFKKAKENAANKMKESHRFDENFDFKQTLQKLKDVIEELAKEQTILVVVDELDRCLPEYAIRVMERLHHLFDEMENVQVILAVDKKQLHNTIHQIYGLQISVEHYLEKFIDFEMTLTEGQSEKIISGLHPQYLKDFEKYVTSEDEVNQICNLLLKGIHVRKKKAIIEKSYMCHRLLKDEEKDDCCILCVEVFCTLLHTFGLDLKKARTKFDLQTPFSEQLFSSKQYGRDQPDNLPFPLKGLLEMNRLFSRTLAQNRNEFNSIVEYSKDQCIIMAEDVCNILLGCYRIIIGFENDEWMKSCGELLVPATEYPLKRISSYVKKFWEFLGNID